MKIHENQYKILKISPSIFITHHIVVIFVFVTFIFFAELSHLDFLSTILSLKTITHDDIFIYIILALA